VIDGERCSGAKDGRICCWFGAVGVVVAGIGGKADCWGEEGKDSAGCADLVRALGAQIFCSRRSLSRSAQKMHILAIEHTFEMIILAYRTIKISLFHG
jgi:hypothetical protein